VANTLNLLRNGAIGFIDWLGLAVSLENRSTTLQGALPSRQKQT